MEEVQKLRAIFKDKYDCIHASGSEKHKEWNQYLESFGAHTVNKLTLWGKILENSLGDLVVVDDPSFMLDSYILIQRDLAWKILVLNYVPDSVKEITGR